MWGGNITQSFRGGNSCQEYTALALRIYASNKSCRDGENKKIVARRKEAPVEMLYVNQPRCRIMLMIGPWSILGKVEQTACHELVLPRGIKCRCSRKYE